MEQMRGTYSSTIDSPMAFPVQIPMELFWKKIIPAGIPIIPGKCEHSSLPTFDLVYDMFNSIIY